MIFTPPYNIVAAPLSLHLHPGHLADLRASGLNDETIRGAGVYSLRPRDIALFFSQRKGVPAQIETAMCLPYPPRGDFARIKIFPALGKMKYAQPPQTGARLYTPFDVKPGEIIVTEGEKKTLAVHQAGFNAVGVGGVWNWLSHGEPIVDLNLIEWDGREVTVIPDSDVFQRIDLLRAIYALGREIQAAAARVLIAQLPQPTAAKVGLDDYLVAGGDIQRLEVFSLSHRKFKNVEFWHSRWKFQKATRAAA